MKRAGRHQRLGIEEDPALQRIVWIGQRIMWGAIAAILAAGLAGAFGEGPLSRATLGGPDSRLRVSYERFCRAGAETEVLIEAEADADAEVALIAGGSFLEDYSAEALAPPPARAVARPGGMELAFRAVAASSAVSVRLKLRPDRPGILRGTLGLAGGPRYEVTQFCHP